MNYTEEEIEDLRKDPVFLGSLERRESEALESGDIIQLYDVLDSYMMIDAGSEEQISRLYEMILDKALDRLAGKLESGDLCNLDDQSEETTLRALYEYAIENYSSGRYHEASELFMMLSILTDEPTFKGAMQIHLVATLKEIDFDEFLNSFVDIEMINSSESHFMLYFYDNANRFLHDNSELIREAVMSMKLKPQ
jgi:hypothetical protein